MRPPDIKTTLLLRTPFSSPKLGFPYIFISIFKTIPLIRTLLDSLKGGLNIGVLLNNTLFHGSRNGDYSNDN